MFTERTFAVLLVVFSVAAPAAISQAPEIWPETITYAVWALSAICLAAACAITFWRSTPKSIAQAEGNIVINERKTVFDQSTNVGDNNKGIVAPTYNTNVHVGKQPRHLSTETGNELLASLPRHKSAYVVHPVNDGEARALAIEIRDFLKARNVPLFANEIGDMTMTPPPAADVHWLEQPDHIMIYVRGQS